MKLVDFYRMDITNNGNRVILVIDTSNMSILDDVLSLGYSFKLGYKLKINFFNSFYIYCSK